MRVPFIYRRRGLQSGSAALALLILTAVWALLWQAPDPSGGSGPGSGGGIGGGTGPGAGLAGAGPGAGTEGLGRGDGPAGTEGAPAANAPPGDPTLADERAAPDSPAEPAELASAPLLPPLRPGFTAADAPPAKPVPAATPARPRAPAGGGVSGAKGGGDGIPRFMGVAAKGSRIVFVLDSSGSMHDTRLAHAKYEVRKSLRSLPVTSSFYIFFFNSVTIRMPGEGLVKAAPAAVASAISWVDSQQCGGGTNPEEAMMEALAMRPDTIFLMTDGVFDDPGVADRIRAANTHECRISTIAFHDPAGEAILRRIAAENGGDFRFVPAPSAPAAAPAASP